jgi:glutamyl-tRNA synthetase
MADSVVTRFAPSPTGYLHIGGARTALFNWLFARGRGGKMLLRIEDTDRERSTEAAVAAIIDGLSWLGLDWDGEPISQFARRDRHAEVARELLDKGQAYRCFATQQELTEMRDTARAAGRPPRYDGRWRDRDPSEAPAGVQPVIRVKAPREGETIIQDHVQGRVAFPNKDLDDFVILRSDGTPTYMHAVVVDDHDMGVTHIIRGDDHLTNAARQAIVYDAMGWRTPEWAHIPLIHGPDGAKLSKRHGALGVEAYRAMGYLPAALRNYLARLGWSHGDDEIFSAAQAQEWFELDGIGKAAARFDFAKLQSVNGHYMRAADDADLLRRLEEILPELQGGLAFAARLDDDFRARLLGLMPGLKERAKTLVELFQSAAFLAAERPIPLDDKGAALLGDEARARLVPSARCFGGSHLERTSA